MFIGRIAPGFFIRFYSVLFGFAFGDVKSAVLGSVSPLLTSGVTGLADDAEGRLPDASAGAAPLPAPRWAARIVGAGRSWYVDQ